jgi:hypothetical protein
VSAEQLALIPHAKNVAFFGCPPTRNGGRCYVVDDGPDDKLVFFERMSCGKV